MVRRRKVLDDIVQCIKCNEQRNKPNFVYLWINTQQKTENQKKQKWKGKWKHSLHKMLFLLQQQLTATLRRRKKNEGEWNKNEWE